VTVGSGNWRKHVGEARHVLVAAFVHAGTHAPTPWTRRTLRIAWLPTRCQGEVVPAKSFGHGPHFTGFDGPYRATVGTPIAACHVRRQRVRPDVDARTGNHARTLRERELPGEIDRSRRHLRGHGGRELDFRASDPPVEDGDDPALSQPLRKADPAVDVPHLVVELGMDVQSGVWLAGLYRGQQRSHPRGIALAPADLDVVPPRHIERIRQREVHGDGVRVDVVERDRTGEKPVLPARRPAGTTSPARQRPPTTA
jgi:hypothetical protein